MLYAIFIMIKILGIILLAVLALLLFSVLAALFIPMRYRVKVKMQEEISVSIKGGWLFRFVSVRYVLTGPKAWKQDLQIRFFFFLDPVAFLKKSRKWLWRQVNRKRKKKRQKEKISGSKEIAKNRLMKLTKERTGSISDTEASAGESLQKPEREPYVYQEAPPIEERPGFFKKLVFAIRKFCDKIRKILKVIRSIPESIGRIFAYRASFLEFWRQEEHCRARSAVWKEVQYLIKKLRPDRIKGCIKFGFEDPSRTGLLLGGLSIFQVWFPKKFRLLPDFEHEVLEVDLDIRGKIQMYLFIKVFWRLWFNQDIRHMFASMSKIAAT